MAVEKLIDQLLHINAKIEIVKHVDTVEDAVLFFQSGVTVDLAFFDIELADGKSFEIFERVVVSAPVIFTTAYDSFALQAFSHLSIDYLLKPIDREPLERALNKYQQLSKSEQTMFAASDMLELKKLLITNRQFKSRILVKAGNKIQLKPVDEIAYFSADGKEVYLIPKGGTRRYLIDHTLDELINLLNPETFFRISRKFIVNIDSIIEIRGMISRKLEVGLTHQTDSVLHVSRERTQDFRKWLDR